MCIFEPVLKSHLCLDIGRRNVQKHCGFCITSRRSCLSFAASCNNGGRTSSGDFKPTPPFVKGRLLVVPTRFPGPLNPPHLTRPPRRHPRGRPRARAAARAASATTRSRRTAGWTPRASRAAAPRTGAASPTRTSAPCCPRRRWRTCRSCAAWTARCRSWSARSRKTISTPRWGACNESAVLGSFRRLIERL